MFPASRPNMAGIAPPPFLALLSVRYCVCIALTAGESAMLTAGARGRFLLPQRRRLRPQQDQRADAAAAFGLPHRVWKRRARPVDERHHDAAGVCGIGGNA